MKAVHFDRYGEPADVLRVTDQTVPTPGAGEVRVKIRLSPVNPSDLLYVRGHYSGVTPHFSPALASRASAMSTPSVAASRG